MDKGDGSQKEMTIEEAKMGVWQILQATNEKAECDERPCEIRESSVEGGGEGLFATRDIEKGEYITTYPVCWVVVTEEGKRSYATCQDIYEDYEDLVKKEDYLNQKCGNYSVGLFEDFTILGDPDVRYDNRLFAHMINDLSVVGEDEYDVDKRNVAFSFLDVHAIKDIKEGEELSICYGRDYWDTPLPDGTTRRGMIGELDCGQCWDCKENPECPAKVSELDRSLRD
tara:strand:- start:1770 stop:2450 length:681 start_codon:yes stop_codon:yes gene_type:complete